MNISDRILAPARDIKDLLFPGLSSSTGGVSLGATLLSAETGLLKADFSSS